MEDTNAKKEDLIPGDLPDMILEMVKDRNEALLSLDEGVIQAYCKKWKIEMPKDEQEFWTGIHIARIQVKSFSDKVKRESHAWLQQNKSRIVTPKSGLVVPRSANQDLRSLYERKKREGKL